MDSQWSRFTGGAGGAACGSWIGTGGASAIAGLDTARVELLDSDDAQQLSASTCVINCLTLERLRSCACIGHVTPSTQHAIRASGVAFQPAHSPIWPADRTAMRAIATERAKIHTSL